MSSNNESEMLRLRKEDIWVQLQGLLEHMSSRNFNKSEAVLLFNETEDLQNTYEALKLDIFKHSTNASERTDCMNISDFSKFDSLFREVRKQCCALITSAKNLYSDCDLTSTSVRLIGSSAQSQEVLLGTILCKAKHKLGIYVQIRCLCDSGAQISIASMDLVDRLRLPILPSQNYINGISSTRVPVLGKVEITLRTRDEKQPLKELNIRATVLNTVCGDLPLVNASPLICRQFAHLPLADEHFYKSGPIDLILGAETFSKLFVPTQPIMFSDSEVGLMAQLTIFGYIIQGYISKETTEWVPEVLTVRSIKEKKE